MRLNVFGRPRPCKVPLPRASRRNRWRMCLAHSLAMIGLAGTLGGCTNLPIGSPFGNTDKDGFFGWHIGAPFDTSDVKTVFVYFKTQTFRRDLQLMLTEAVEKEIDMRTPYKVVGNPAKADSILRGVITVTDKNLVVEAPTNLPREVNGIDDRLGELDPQPGDPSSPRPGSRPRSRKLTTTCPKSARARYPPIRSSVRASPSRSWI